MENIIILVLTNTDTDIKKRCSKAACVQRLNSGGFLIKARKGSS
jgi:hypothetical protein